MVDQIQLTGHKQSQYDRRTGEWSCDGGRLGSPCKNGPNTQGTCPHAKAGVRHPCKPQLKEGEYNCDRSEDLGGKCFNGPDEFGGCGITYPPCRPRAGYKIQRRKWTQSMVIIAVAFLALLLGATQMKTWMEPGNISSQHRFSSGCETCHIDSGDTFSEWWIVGNKNMWDHEPSKEYPCTKCHEFKGPEMQAHNMDSIQIIDIQKRLNPNAPIKIPDQIACHQCHTEHKGTMGIHANLDNQQCQSCHQKSFNGFDDSHPEFSNFPLPKQKRPLFDHSKHITRFKQKKYESSSPKDCATCHMPDEAGVVSMPDFESSCATCHLQKDILNIGGKQASAVSWITVPKIDADKLKIGQWPNCKTQGVNSIAALSPITYSLLSADPKARNSIKILEERKTKFDKLKNASEEEKIALESLAWSFKQLLWDLNSGKKIRWESTEKNLPKQAKNKLARSTSINSDMLSLFTQQFFPDLENTVGQKTINADGYCMDKDQIRGLRKQWGKRKDKDIQGWYIQFNNKTLELGYRTQQHKDMIQQSLMDQYWYNPKTFEWLKEKKKSINCQKCHAENETKNAWVWQQEPVSLSTQFRHKPHLVLGVGCNSCHVIKPKQEDTIDIDLSDFKTINKSTCQECHKPGGRSDNCSKCHSYHSDIQVHENKHVNWDMINMEEESVDRP